MHLAKRAQQGDYAGIARDETKHGKIPNDLRASLGLSPDSSQSSVLEPQSCVTLWGTGTPKRELLYSDDMADACLYLMNLSGEAIDSVLSPLTRLYLTSVVVKT